MLGHEAALHYAQEGNHFESRCVLSIACRRSSVVQSRLGGAFISGMSGGADREREREWFKQQLQEFVAAVAPVWKLIPLDLSAHAVAHHQLHQRADVPGEGAAPSGAA